MQFYNNQFVWLDCPKEFTWGIYKYIYIRISMTELIIVASIIKQTTEFGLKACKREFSSSNLVITKIICAIFKRNWKDMPIYL